MGTYSYYQLKPVEGLFADKFEEDLSLGVIEISYGDYLHEVLEATCKWYGAKDDLAKVSENYPDTLIVVEKIREDGEHFLLQAKNGHCHMQQGRVVYEEQPTFPAADDATIAKRQREAKVREKIAKLQAEIDALQKA